MAIMIKEEHYHLLLRTVAAQTRSAGEERGGGGLRKVSANAFSRLTKFAKGEEDGKDWNFDFSDILSLECPELLQKLEGDRAHVGGDDTESSRIGRRQS